MTSLMKHIVPVAALCALLSIGKAVVDPVSAAETANPSMTWLDQDYPYLSVDQTLPETLRELGHNLDITINVSPEVKGRVRHYSHDATAGDFLDYLTTEHRLDWVFDQGRLYITTVAEKRLRSWPGNIGAFERVKAALANAKIDDPRFPLGFEQGRGELTLAAPPRYVAAAAPVIERVLAPKVTRVVNVIHGRPRRGGTSF